LTQANRLRFQHRSLKRDSIKKAVFLPPFSLEQVPTPHFRKAIVATKNQSIQQPQEQVQTVTTMTEDETMLKEIELILDGRIVFGVN
jgi:transposase